MTKKMASPTAASRSQPGPADQLQASKQETARTLNKLLKKEKRKLAKMEQELAACSQAETYKKQAELLTINLGSIKRGADSVMVDDLYQPGTRLAIALDPSIPVPETIKKYYRYYKKLVKRSRLLPDRIKKVHAYIRQLENLARDLQKFDNHNDINKIRKILRDESGFSVKPSGNKKPDRTEVRYRTFTTSTGWKVYVGKSSRDNDTLTFKIAKPHDYWFHVMGASGSHVVLRCQDKKKPLDPVTLQESAGVAAYFSKLKKSKSVPVQYTRKKFVRKPRKAAPGLVIIEREKTIFVEPKLIKDIP